MSQSRKNSMAAEAMKQDLLKQIRDGKLRPGDRLPGERTLAEQYQISYLTARRGIDELIEREILERRPRSGTFVRINLNYLGISGKSRIIIFINNDLNTSLSLRTLNAIEARARQSNYWVIVANSGLDFSTEAMFLRNIPESSIAGVIICPIAPPVNSLYIRELQRLGIPVVTVDHNYEAELCDSVECDNFDAAYRATSYLISLGHTRIGHITIPLQELPGNHIARERLEGYKKALMDNKFPVESCYISHMLSEFYFEPISKINLFYLGYKPALNLLRQKKRPSAIFLAIDELAGGVYHAAEELGIAIPDELSLVGLNNLELCEKFHPALSSIAQPFEEMGRRAVELLLNRLQGTAPVPFVHERLTASLVVRQSSVIYQPSFAPSGATLHR